jgi:hypothetical protein
MPSSLFAWKLLAYYHPPLLAYHPTGEGRGRRRQRIEHKKETIYYVLEQGYSSL